MANIDMRDKLKENPFSYRIGKDKIFIYYFQKEVKIIKGKEMAKLLNNLEGQDEFGIQLALAKVTKNFKRGNERKVNK